MRGHYHLADLPPLTELGAYLLMARQAAGLTLRAVLDKTGIPLGYLTRLESGEMREPSPRVLQQLAAVSGVDYAHLMRLSGYAMPAALIPSAAIPGIERLSPVDRAELVGIVALKLRRPEYSKEDSAGGAKGSLQPAPLALVRPAPAATSASRRGDRRGQRVVGYIRTDRSGLRSVDAQKEALDSWAAEHRLAPLRTFVDAGVAATTLERPGLQRLLREIDAGRVEVLVCTHLDRLARDAGLLARLCRRLDEHGVELVAVEQGLELGRGVVATGVFQQQATAFMERVV